VQPDVSQPPHGDRLLTEASFKALHQPHHGEVGANAAALVATEDKRVLWPASRCNTSLKLLCERDNIEHTEVNALTGEGMNSVRCIANQHNIALDIMFSVTLP